MVVGSSSFWQSLIWGRDALKLGLCLRVEDGSSIRVFIDPWLLRPSLVRPITTPNELNQSMR
ncbi:hypothetical protein TorRG33x02_190660, partial [Trema orientale]